MKCTINPVVCLRGRGIRIGTRLLLNSSRCLCLPFRCLHTPFIRPYSDKRDTTVVNDNRSRLSRLWIPTGGIATSSEDDSHSKLIRAGFLRQAHSGIFHMLPLGRRVQNKLEALIDKYMSKLSASKVELSSISSQELWAQSGRLAKGSELFRFTDRKDVGYLLSPTHEEEITSLVGSIVKSYKELPIRLYQISRKYRDELRPRHGLLRSREFVMKDLYTFDSDLSLALRTYHEVREIYTRLFDELKIPYLEAEADSGDMGGNLSHEFHFPTAQGEDHVISCTGCGYVANEELAESPVTRPSSQASSTVAPDLQVWRGITRDRLTLVNVWYPGPSPNGRKASPAVPEINTHAIKAIIPGFDPSIEDPVTLWAHQTKQPELRRLVNLVDGRLSDSIRKKIESNNPDIPFWPANTGDQQLGITAESVAQDTSTQQPLNLLRIKDGDACPRCPDGTLMVQKAIELGHTFHLGTRYSDPLKAVVTVPAEANSTSTKEVPMEMGCHGIGVSRMIGAVADTLADEKGLNWPRVMAPFEIIVVPGKGLDEAALEVYDVLSHRSKSDEPQRDLVLDDRVQTFPWKMRDADLVGYPVIVVVGRRWKTERMCEVQCRRLKVRTELPLDEVPAFTDELLSQL